MKLPAQSLRWRIQIWHGLLLAGVLAGFGITAWRLQEANDYRRLDAELELRLGVLHQSLELGMDGEPGELEGMFQPGPDGFYFCIWSRTGAVLRHSPNFPAGESRPTPGMHGTALSRGGRREMHAFTPPGECVLAGVSERASREALMHSAEALGALGFGVLIVGLAIGGWITGRAIAPIDRISAAAARIAAGNLDERIDSAGSSSELGRLAGVLNETFEKLAGLFEQQSRFTSDAAHELRTPVSVILAQAQLALSRPRESDEYRETIRMTQRAAFRMQSLIDSLLTLSILDGKEARLESAHCDLAEIGRQQIDLIRPLAEERGITVKSALEPCRCMADAERLGQVFANLLANAVKFNRPGGEVRLVTHRENGSAIVEVTDTGAGIEERHLPHLFERFYRAEESRNRSTGGAGLGLAICRTIAEAHGGGISVRSAPGKGSVFTVRIPTEV